MIKKVILLIFFGFSLLTISVALDLVDPLYQKGLSYYSAKNYAAAVDYLGQVCDLAEDHLDARYYLTQALIALKRYKEALSNARILVSKKPENQQYQELLKVVQSCMGVSITLPGKLPPSNNTKTSTTSSSILSNTKSKSVVDLASSAGALSRPKTSSQTEKIDPLDAAISALDLREFASAAVLLDEIIKKEPKNAQAHHFRGMVEYYQNNFKVARKYFEEATKLKPDMFNSLFLIGDSYMKENLYADAETAFKKALTVKDDPFTKINLAQSKRFLGKTDEAINILQEILKKDEKLHDARIVLAESYLDKGEVETAAEEINKVLSSDPQNALARFVKAKVLLAGDLYDDAILSLKQALVLSPNNPTFITLMARVYLKMGKTNEAIETAGKVVNQFPDNWEARMILVESFLNSNDLGSAQDHLDKAAAINPSPETFLMQARISRKSNDKDKAKSAYQTFLAYEPKNGVILCEFASYMEEVGDVEYAMELYQEIANRLPDTTFANSALVRLATLRQQEAAKNPGQTPQPSVGATLRSSPTGRKRGNY